MSNSVRYGISTQQHHITGIGPYVNATLQVPAVGPSQQQRESGACTVPEGAQRLPTSSCHALQGTGRGGRRPPGLPLYRDP